MGRQTKILIKSDLKIEQLVKQIIDCEEKQVVLEISEGSNLLNNEINLRLLKFYSEEEDKEIILKTTDPALISLAQRLGISTVKESELVMDKDVVSIYQEAEDEIAAAPEDSLQKARPAGPNRGGLFTAILIVLFSLILAIWWFLTPKAVINVYPKEEDLPFEAIAKIGTIFTDEDIADCKIPARFISNNTSITVQTVTSGQKIIGVTPAVGKVTLINSTNQPVVVPKGSTVIAKDGTRFLTDRDVLVPKKSIKFQSGIAMGEDFGTIDVGITAQVKGTQGNQPAKAITKIDPKFQLLLKVANLAPTNSGTNKKVAIATLDDVKKGEDEAKRQMQLVGPEELTPRVSSDSLFVRDLIKLEVIRLTYSPGIGEEGDTLQTNLEYRASVLAPSLVNIRQFLVKQLDLNLPPNFEASNQDVKLVSVKIASATDGDTKLEMVGKGTVHGILNIDKIKNLIKGKTVSEAKQLLSDQNEIGDFKMNLRGAKTRLPGFTFQIKILLPSGSKSK